MAAAQYRRARQRAISAANSTPWPDSDHNSASSFPSSFFMRSNTFAAFFVSFSGRGSVLRGHG